MGESVRLYAGTHDGVIIWRSYNGRWDEVGRSFAGGIIESVVGCRQRPERIFAGVTRDGLYRSDDGGKKWTKVLQGDVRSAAVDPRDDNVIYAGLEPVQLYRSEDGGDTWDMLTSLLAHAHSRNIRYFQTFILPREEHPPEVGKKWWFPLTPHLAHITHIFIHPDDTSIIYLSIEHGGILRSLDRGKSWEETSGGIDYLDIHMVENFPRSFNRYYVSSARGFFTSKDPTHGWVRAERGFTRDYFHSFIILPPSKESDHPTMLVETADKSPGSWRREGRGPNAAIFRSEDGAESWQQVSEGLPDLQEPMVWGLTRHPYDENTAFAGLGRVARGYALPLPHYPGSGGSGAIYITRDRGESWQDLNLELPPDRVLYTATG